MKFQPLAFPLTEYSDHPDRCGMTLRDYIACAALQAIITNPRYNGTRDEYVASAYRYADTMLKVRGGA